MTASLSEQKPAMYVQRTRSHLGQDQTEQYAIQGAMSALKLALPQLAGILPEGVAAALGPAITFLAIPLAFALPELLAPSPHHIWEAFLKKLPMPLDDDVANVATICSTEKTSLWPTCILDYLHVQMIRNALDPDLQASARSIPLNIPCIVNFNTPQGQADAAVLAHSLNLPLAPPQSAPVAAPWGVPLAVPAPFVSLCPNTGAWWKRQVEVAQEQMRRNQAQAGQPTSSPPSTAIPATSAQPTISPSVGGTMTWPSWGLYVVAGVAVILLIAIVD